MLAMNVTCINTVEPLIPNGHLSITDSILGNMYTVYSLNYKKLSVNYIDSIDI